MTNEVSLRGLYGTFAALVAVTVALTALLASRGVGLQAVRGVVPFELDQPPPTNARHDAR